MSKYVDYYASLASPYTYMGGRRLPEIIENTGADFHIKPPPADCPSPSAIRPGWPIVWWSSTGGSVIGRSR